MKTLYHHSITKGNRAELLTMLTLQEQGYIVFSTTCGNSPVDLIALSPSGRAITIQVKYSSEGKIPSKSSWSDKNGYKNVKTDTSMFDTYALVREDKVIFAPSSFIGTTIRFELPTTNTLYWWWEDFKLLETDVFERRRLKQISPKPSKVKKVYQKKGRPTCQPKLRRVDRPDRDSLASMVWSQPLRAIASQFGVSDVAVRKWCVKENIDLPGRGHWRQMEVMARSEGLEPPM